MEVSLRPLSQANVRAVCELSLAEDQQDLIAPAAYTVAEANYEPNALLRAIYLEENPAGVLLVELEHETPRLVRFMIDAKHQGRGIGRRAIELLVSDLRHTGWSHLEVAVFLSHEGSEGFWRHCGFTATDLECDGERLLSRVL